MHCPSTRRNPQVIVARTDKGVIRSADGGETWRAADGLPAKSVSSLLRAPTGVMYASQCEDCSHLYRSADGGATWSEIEVATPVFRFGYAVAKRFLSVGFHFACWQSIRTAPATLYAKRTLSLFSGGLWRSSDGGVSWQPAGLGSHRPEPGADAVGALRGNVCGRGVPQR
jgi:hypothetical protein